MVILLTPIINQIDYMLIIKKLAKISLELLLKFLIMKIELLLSITQYQYLIILKNILLLSVMVSILL